MKTIIPNAKISFHFALKKTLTFLDCPVPLLYIINNMIQSGVLFFSWLFS